MSNQLEWLMTTGKKMLIYSLFYFFSSNVLEFGIFMMLQIFSDKFLKNVHAFKCYFSYDDTSLYHSFYLSLNIYQFQSNSSYSNIYIFLPFNTQEFTHRIFKLFRLQKFSNHHEILLQSIHECFIIRKLLLMIQLCCFLIEGGKKR